MADSQQHQRGVLYTIICAAPPSTAVHRFIELAQFDCWDVCAIATPQALTFLDVPLLTTLTGYPVRSTYKHPSENDALPKADAIVVVPATFNTLNKWALGIADTLALGILCEALGRKAPPIVVAPCLKADLAHHPAFSKSIILLKQYDVHILHEPEKYLSPNIVPWQMILDALNKAVQQRTSSTS